MVRLRKACTRLLHPAPKVLVLVTCVCALSLFVIFALHLQDALAAPLFYAPSAYAFVMDGIAIAKCAAARIGRNSVARRIRGDSELRLKLTLILPLAVNIAYAGFKGALGIVYHSSWFGSTAAYHMTLALARYLLLRNARGTKFDARRLYVVTGILLVALTLALAVMAAHMVSLGAAPVYPGFIIYGVAAYTFFSLGTAISNAIRVRGTNNSILFAARNLSLTNALTALFSLQNALIAAFGRDEVFRLRMNAATGLSVFLLIGLLALRMIRTGLNVSNT